MTDLNSHISQSLTQATVNFIPTFLMKTVPSVEIQFIYALCYIKRNNNKAIYFDLFKDTILNTASKVSYFDSNDIVLVSLCSNGIVLVNLCSNNIVLVNLYQE